MARYYFDIHDGHCLTRDIIGTECSGPNAIMAEAKMALPAFARDTVIKDGDRQAMMVFVRNEHNLTVCTATLTFASVWLGEDAPLVADDPDLAGHPPLTWGR